MIVITFVLFAILLIWLGVLTFFFWSLSAHYNNLVKATNKKTLQAILETLLLDMETTKKDIAKLQRACDTIMQDGEFHIQKIGLLRFNPFKDTGGDQSFILAFLDGNDNGIVMSGLYSRSGTRWYAKKVKKGIGVEHNLSDEEKKAIVEAKKIA